MPRLSILVLFGLTLAPPAGPSAAAPAATRTLVICAPGYPGNTAAAQPTMDAFAKLAAEAARWRPESLRALYLETADAGLKRLGEPDAVIALVSLPFFLQHEADLRLAARLQVVQESGAAEIWSLAARRGRVASSAALDGWEITGGAGYAPQFVRGPVLGAWGPLPASARVTFSANVLSALRRAAAGDPVAVVLDGPQAKALETLPFGADLEVVARSVPMPGSLVCAVGSRLPPKQAEAFVRGLERLPSLQGSAEILKTMRLQRFEAVDMTALDAARRSYAGARAIVPAGGSGRPGRPAASAAGETDP